MGRDRASSDCGARARFEDVDLRMMAAWGLGGIVRERLAAKVPLELSAS